MMIIPQPIKDELIVGLLGRLLAINGLKAAFIDPAIRLLKKHFPELDTLEDQVQIPEKLITKILNINGDLVFRQHTLLPLRKFVVKEVNQHNNRAALVGNLRKGNKLFHLCEDCVGEDIEHYGFSIWHREHQLPGAYWCLKHAKPLLQVFHRAPFLSFPEELIKRGNVIDIPSNDWEIKPSVEKYLEFLENILSDRLSMSLQQATNLIRVKAMQRGYSKRAIQFGQLNHDVVDSFGSSSLQLIAPRLLEKLSSGELGANYNKHLLKLCSTGGIAYWVIAFSFLFDDYEDVVATFEKNKGDSVNLYEDIEVPTENYDQLVYSAFIECEGDTQKMSERIDLSMQLVESKLKRKGLITLGEGRQKTRNLNALRAFLIEKKELQESANMANLSLESFVELLRAVSEPMTQALHRMNSNSQNSSSIASRI